VTIKYRIMLTSDGVRQPQSHELTFVTSEAAENECNVRNAKFGATPKMKWIVVEDVHDRGETSRSSAKPGFRSRRR
jgi:hypothetical protein